jgi:hypothetical protein
MKDELIATAYTMFLTVAVFASPVLLEWYVTEILGREYIIENMPVGVVVFMVILFIAQILLAVYFWINAFNPEEK